MAEHVDYTSLGTTRWTFRTNHLDLGYYVEWSAESIREKRGGFWGWTRKGEPRAFSFIIINGGGDRLDVGTSNGAIVTVEPGFLKANWVFAFAGYSIPPGSGLPPGPPSPAVPFDPRLVTDVQMRFRHRGHGYLLDHSAGLKMIDP
jgi:hypothetical protein